jgi:chorismate lyase / 3-hydroxybenzoate synthase
VRRPTSAPIPTFLDPLATADARLTGHVLGAVRYGDTSANPQLNDGHPTLLLHMVADPADGFTEVWHTTSPVKSDELNGVVFAHDGEYLFCSGRVAPSTSYARPTRAAYLTALGVAEELGYTNLVRMWNFVNDINQSNGAGLEIYRDFCVGRAEAFEQKSYLTQQLPAATGIGSLGGGIGFYFIAARAGVRVNIENSRQTPAYRYPERYGPRSPSFARATYLGPDGAAGSDGQIYVSGTSSVVGHLTMHAGDVERQFQETLANLRHLVHADNLGRHGLDRGHDLTDLRNIKVYVRHRGHLDAVRELCAAAFDPAAEIGFLTVDICRADLLVEIEAMIR